MAKTTCFNLIILDESGSMSALTPQTVSGCNETLNIIRNLQKEHSEEQRHLVSIYVFQSGSAQYPSRYLCKNVPADSVKDITVDDYHAYGCTPMLDAIGTTLTELRETAATHEDAIASITIITDGYENASTQYTWEKVAALISSLKELGWNINFMGANIDVEEVAKKMHIDNTNRFEATAEGVSDSFAQMACCLNSFHEATVREDRDIDIEERIARRKKRSKNFFNIDSEDQPY